MISISAGVLRVRIRSKFAGRPHEVLHRLTPAGEAMLRDGHVVVNKVLAKSLAPLTAIERQQLHGLLNRLLDEPDR